MLTDRRAVRIVVMRSTIHLVTADDCRFLRPLHDDFLLRAFRASSWVRGLEGADLEAVAAAGRALVDEEPLTFMARRLAGAAVARQRPGVPGPGRRARAPLVQVPPWAVWGGWASPATPAPRRGSAGRSAGARWTSSSCATSPPSARRRSWTSRRGRA